MAENHNYHTESKLFFLRLGGRLFHGLLLGYLLYCFLLCLGWSLDFDHFFITANKSTHCTAALFVYDNDEVAYFTRQIISFFQSCHSLHPPLKLFFPGPMETGSVVMYKLFYNTNDDCQDIMQFIFGKILRALNKLDEYVKKLPL